MCVFNYKCIFLDMWVKKIQLNYMTKSDRNSVLVEQCICPVKQNCRNYWTKKMVQLLNPSGFQISCSSATVYFIIACNIFSCLCKPNFDFFLLKLLQKNPNWTVFIKLPQNLCVIIIKVFFCIILTIMHLIYYIT